MNQSLIKRTQESKVVAVGTEDDEAGTKLFESICQGLVVFIVKPLGIHEEIVEGGLSGVKHWMMNKLEKVVLDNVADEASRHDKLVDVQLEL